MVKSMIQYIGVLHSPNLHQLIILTWSTDATLWFVSLTFHTWVAIVRKKWSSLGVLHTPNLHQRFIFRSNELEYSPTFYQCPVIVCVLDPFFTLHWPWHKRPIIYDRSGFSENFPRHLQMWFSVFTDDFIWIFIRPTCRDVLWYGAGVCPSVCPQSMSDTDWTVPARTVKLGTLTTYKCMTRGRTLLIFKVRA